MYRFEVLPTINDSKTQAEGGVATREGALSSVVGKGLCRSASQPAVFPPNRMLEKRLKRLSKAATAGAGGSGSTANPFSSSSSSSAQKTEDDLDIIEQIIGTDESMTSVDSGEEATGTSLRSQSLTHLPGQFSQFAGSLPSLHHAGSMHVIHANYNSAPDFMQLENTRGGRGSFNAHMMGPRGGGGRGGAVGMATSAQHEPNKEPGAYGEFQTNPPPPAPPPPPLPPPPGFMGQEEVMGLRENEPLNAQRRNSLYEGQGAVATPTLPSSGGQSTPFVFAHPRSTQLSGYGAGEDYGGTLVRSEGGTGEYSAGGSRRWSQQTPNMPNTYQYTPVSEAMGPGPGGCKEERQEGEEGDSHSPSTGLLYDYLTGVGTGGDRTQEEASSKLGKAGSKLAGSTGEGTKSRNASFELPSSIKGKCNYVDSEAIKSHKVTIWLLTTFTRFYCHLQH